jgi:hypothetical protein
MFVVVVWWWCGGGVVVLLVGGLVLIRTPIEVVVNQPEQRGGQAPRGIHFLREPWCLTSGFGRCAPKSEP